MKRRNGDHELYTFLSKEQLQEYKKRQSTDVKEREPRPILTVQKGPNTVRDCDNPPKLVFKPWPGPKFTSRNTTESDQTRFTCANTPKPLPSKSNIKFQECGPDIDGYRFVGVAEAGVQSELSGSADRVELASAAKFILSLVGHPAGDFLGDETRVREYLQTHYIYTQAHMKSLRVLLHPDRNRGSSIPSGSYTLAFQLVDQLYKNLSS